MSSTARTLSMVLAPLVGGAIAVLVHDDVPPSPSPPRPPRPATPIVEPEEPSRAEPPPTEAPTPATPASPRVEEPGLPFVARSRHYRVHTDISVDRASWTAVNLERAYDEFLTRFGTTPLPRSPDGLLPVLVYSDRQVYHRGPRKGRPWPEVEPGVPAAGYCDHQDGTAHSVRQDDSGASWITVVHEAAHQFHGLSLGWSAPFWLREGIAHDLEHDIACGTDLQGCSHQPMIRRAQCVLHSAEFRVQDALDARVLRGPFSLTERRAIGMLLTRFLRLGRDGRYAHRFERLVRHASAGDRVPRTHRIDPRGDEMHAELLEFARGLRVPGTTEIRCLGVTGRTSTSGRARGSSCTLLLSPRGAREEVDHLAFSLVHPLEDGDEVGFVLGYRAPDDHLRVRFDAFASVLVAERVTPDGTERLHTSTPRAKIHLACRPLTLDVAADGTISARRNGSPMTEFRVDRALLEGAVGLYAAAGDLRESAGIFVFDGVRPRPDR